MIAARHICYGILAAGSLALAGAGEAQNFGGVYGGVHFGLGSVNLDGALDTSSTTNPVEDPSVLDLKGPLGGVHVGVNFDNGNLIWGFEGDYTVLGYSDSSAAAVPDAGAPGPTTDTISADIDSVATLRGRVGVPQGNLLYYGTAGAAFAEGSFSFLDDESVGAGAGTLSLNSTGYVVGAGVEGNVSGGPLTWRLEALYYGFNDSKNASGLTADSDPGDRVELKDTLAIRFGLTYHFQR